MEELSIWQVWLWSYSDDPYEQSYWEDVTAYQAVMYLNDGYLVRLV